MAINSKVRFSTKKSEKEKRSTYFLQFKTKTKTNASASKSKLESSFVFGRAPLCSLQAPSYNNNNNDITAKNYNLMDFNAVLLRRHKATQQTRTKTSSKIKDLNMANKAIDRERWNTFIMLNVFNFGLCQFSFRLSETILHCLSDGKQNSQFWVYSESIDWATRWLANLMLSNE